MKKSTLIILAFLVFASAKTIAHGVHLEPSFQRPAVIVMSSYSENQPAAGAAVTVYSPSAPEKPFQKGETDAAGKFAFIPDVPGEWTFVVDDQKGHREKIAVPVTEIFLQAAPEAIDTLPELKPATDAEQVTIHEHEHEMPLANKIITGLALIFGITGISYGLMSARKQKNNRT